MGQYKDRDYSLEGLGKRVDNLEDTVYPVKDSIDRIVKLIERWAPILVMAAVSSGWVGGKFGAFLDYCLKHAPV